MFHNIWKGTVVCSGVFACIRIRLLKQEIFMNLFELLLEGVNTFFLGVEDARDGGLSCSCSCWGRVIRREGSRSAVAGVSVIGRRSAAVRRRDRSGSVRLFRHVVHKMASQFSLHGSSAILSFAIGLEIVWKLEKEEKKFCLVMLPGRIDG